MSRKGTKVDLATFQAGSSFEAALPTAPKVREEGDDGRRRRGGFGREGGDFGRDREGGGKWGGDRDREGGSGGGRWGSDRSGDRDGGSKWGADRDKEAGSRWGNDREESRGAGGSWSRGGPSSSSDNFPSFAGRTADTRPDNLRLKLTSKRTTEEGSASSTAAEDAQVEKVASSFGNASLTSSSTPSSSEPGAGEDKWTKVFGKSASAAYQPPASRFGQSSSSTGKFGGRSTQDVRQRNDDVSDPRFASFGRNNDRGEESSGGWQTRKIITTPSAMSEASRRAKEEFEAKQAEKAAADEKKRLADEKKEEARKAAKAAKLAAKEAVEQEQKAQKAAAAQAAIDEANRTKELIVAGATMLADTVASGAKGEALTESLKQKQSENPSFTITAGALVSAILPTLQLEATTATTAAPPSATNWCKDTEYGHALKALTSKSDRRKQQLAILYAVQGYCAEKNFPVMWVSVKGDKPNEKKIVQKKLINSLFTALYAAEIVDDETYLFWNDEDDSDVVAGKLTAVVQTTEFIQLLKARDDEEEEEEDDEVDAPREIVK